MKRIGAIGVAIFLAVFGLCACGKKEPSFAPSSPQEEYARIYGTDGQAFDFDTVTTFTRTSSIEISGDVFNDVVDEHARPLYPVRETNEYKYESKDEKVRSQQTTRQIASYATDKKPTYAPYVRHIFAENSLFTVPMFADGTQNTSKALTPDKKYADTAAYFADVNRCFDTALQTVKPYDLAYFSSFTGKSEGSRYRMTGIVDVAGHGAQFLDAFMANYPFKHWYTPIGDEGRSYEYFLDPSLLVLDGTRIRVEIVSDRNGICSVTERLDVYASSKPVTSLYGEKIVITATTTFDTKAFSEEIIAPQTAA